MALLHIFVTYSSHIFTFSRLVFKGSWNKVHKFFWIETLKHHKQCFQTHPNKKKTKKKAQWRGTRILIFVWRTTKQQSIEQQWILLKTCKNFLFRFFHTQKKVLKECLLEGFEQKCIKRHRKQKQKKQTHFRMTS